MRSSGFLIFNEIDDVAIEGYLKAKFTFLEAPFMELLNKKEREVRWEMTALLKLDLIFLHFYLESLQL